ncbi:MAG: DedA family protein [Patescibacteria group bacterium]|nr:DedA family protein [Patescibacteria group bacterium]
MLESLGLFVISIIAKTGYIGVFILMTVESACIPLPSEVTMPFAGFLVAKGTLNLWLVALIGGLGNLAGSLAAYYVGFWGQEHVVRQIIKKWGRYVLISEREFDHAKKWFIKYDEPIVFFSRLLPAVRTFISLPAGVAKMPLKKFIFYTISGSFIWSFILAYVGMILGNNWTSLKVYFHKFDIVIIVAFIVLVGFYIYRKLKHLKK